MAMITLREAIETYQASKERLKSEPIEVTRPNPKIINYLYNKYKGLIPKEYIEYIYFQNYNILRSNKKTKIDTTKFLNDLYKKIRFNRSTGKLIHIGKRRYPNEN